LVVVISKKLGSRAALGCQGTGLVKVNDAGKSEESDNVQDLMTTQGEVNTVPVTPQPFYG
jgi:hypothetical protein